jgi:hypothetical protein
VAAYVEKNSGNYQFGFRCIDHDGSHIVYWSGCGGRIVRGRGVQTARNTTIWLFSQSVWNPYESIMVGGIVIKCNCITVRIGNYLSAVCQIVFGLKQKDASSLFAFNSASLYANKEVPAKQKGLEFNASKDIVGVALIYSHHRIVLEGRLE